MNQHLNVNEESWMSVKQDTDGRCRQYLPRFQRRLRPSLLLICCTYTVSEQFSYLTWTTCLGRRANFSCR